MRPIFLAVALCVAATGQLAAETPLEAMARNAAQTPSRPVPTAAELMQAFQDYCLNYFPDQAALRKSIADRHLAPATKADRDLVTLTIAGDAWTIATAKGPLVLTVAETEPGQQTCSVAGVIRAGTDTNTAFNDLVTQFVAAKNLGLVVRVPPRFGHVAGKIATAQLLNVTPKDAARQAFVNVEVSNPDGTMLARLSRSVTAPAKPAK